MPKDHSSQKLQELSLRQPDVDLSARIQIALQDLLGAIKDEIEQICSRARDLERLAKQSLAEEMLLTKEEATQTMRMSASSLDRRIKRGEIEVIYFDRRPRFRQKEIARFIDAHARRVKTGRRR